MTSGQAGTAKRWTEYVALDTLEGAEKNPKRHHADLGRSVARFGFADAPILDERTGRLVAGHGRREELERLWRAGAAPPDGVQVDAGGQWLVPVQRGWASKNDSEAAAFLVAHNRIGEAGGWDQEELGRLLDEIEEPAGLGFSRDDLNRLLVSSAQAVQPIGPVDGIELDEALVKTVRYATCPKCTHRFPV